MLGKDGRECHERQNLGDDLEDVNERPPGRKVVEEPLRHLSMVVAGPVADPEDEAPSISAACGGRGTFEGDVPALGRRRPRRAPRARTRRR